MKKLKIVLTFLISISFLACGNDDDGGTTTDLPAVTFNVDTVIALAPNTDITNLVTFNGQNAATYTSELTLGSSLRVGRPEGLQANDVFVYSEISVDFEDEFGELIEVDFDELTNISSDGNLQFVIPAGQPANYFDLLEVSVFEIVAVDAELDTDLDYKYNLEVFIERGGTRFGPYFIDPKIRIKSRN